MIVATVLLASLSIAQSAPKCESTNRDLGLKFTNLVCPEGKQKDAGLCYNPCPEGFKGVGPVCWKGIKSHPRGAGTPMRGHCPEGAVLEGLFCYKKCPENYIITDIAWKGDRKVVSPYGSFCTQDPKFFKCEL